MQSDSASVGAMRKQGKQDETRKYGSLGGVSDGSGHNALSEPPLSKRFTTAGNQDPLFLFTCHAEWYHNRNLKAYQALLAALDDSDGRIRVIAEMMLHRCSPRPKRRAGAFIQSTRPIMEWFLSTEREQEGAKGGPASGQEIQSAFDDQRDYLYWIALLITGDDALANLAVVNASGLSANYSGVFRDWLNGWAKYATVRAAVRQVHGLISASAAYFADSPSEHSDEDVFSDGQIASLRHLDPKDIIVALDPLARSALVLRGIQHASIEDCALLLDVPRRSVAGAYSQALRWNGERTYAHRAPAEDRLDPEFDYTPAGPKAATPGKRETDAGNKRENAARTKRYGDEASL